MFNENHHYSSRQPAARGFMPQVFAWMTASLAISGGVAYYLSPTVNPVLFNRLVTGPIVWLMFAQIGLIMYYSWSWQKLSFGVSSLIFLTYSALSGVTLAPLAYVYTGASLVETSIIAASTFAVMAVYGWTTRHDLSQYGSVLTMGVFGIMIALLVNAFMQSGTANLVISFIGVMVFTVLIAYDMQNLKRISHSIPDDPSMRGKLALRGALHLYLSIVNLFIFLLRLTGQRR